MNSEHPDPRYANFLRTLLSQIPVLVLRLSPDGLVLAANPEVTRATGYDEAELLGRNFWGLLFPGKLFQQIPKFLGGVHEGGSVRDRPMVLRTKAGRECVVAWSRCACKSPEGKIIEMICTGVDLTQRLIDADRPATPEITTAPINSHGGEGADIIEGDFVQPLAVSPPVRREDEMAVGEVQKFLDMVEQRGAALTAILSSQIPALPPAGSTRVTRGALRTAQLDIEARQTVISEVLMGVHSVATLCKEGKRSTD